MIFGVEKNLKKIHLQFQSASCFLTIPFCIGCLLLHNNFNQTCIILVQE